VTGLGTSARAPGWWTLGATYTSPIVWQRYQLQAQAHNVLDRTWYTPGSPSQQFDRLAQPGRRLRLSVSATL
jgi:outer membrane receptor protein involved in Fe transport